MDKLLLRKIQWLTSELLIIMAYVTLNLLLLD